MTTRPYTFIAFLLAGILSLFGLLLAQQPTATAPGAVQVGSGDARDVEFVVDGRPYFILRRDGTFEGVNGGQITGGIGATTDVTFSAASFTTNGDKAWTVEAADVITNHYASIGKLRFHSMDIVSTDIGAGTTGSNLIVALPYAVKKRVVVPAVLNDNNVWSSNARCLIAAGSSSLVCTLNTAVVFTTVTGTAGLRLQFWAEVP